jgi:hypothetical protein
VHRKNIKESWQKFQISIEGMSVISFDIAEIKNCKFTFLFTAFLVCRCDDSGLFHSLGNCHPDNIGLFTKNASILKKGQRKNVMFFIRTNFLIKLQNLNLTVYTWKCSKENEKSFWIYMPLVYISINQGSNVADTHIFMGWIKIFDRPIIMTDVVLM